MLVALMRVLMKRVSKGSKVIMTKITNETRMSLELCFSEDDNSRIVTRNKFEYYNNYIK